MAINYGTLKSGSSLYKGYYKNSYNPNGSNKSRNIIGDLEEGNFKYIGQFNDDECNGNCIARYCNGDIYIGKYEKGKRNGKGLYFCHQDKTYFEGSWYDDRYLKSDLTILKEKVSFKNVKIGDIVKDNYGNFGIVFDKMSNGWCKIKSLNDDFRYRVSDLLLITFK